MSDGVLVGVGCCDGVIIPVGVIVEVGCIVGVFVANNVGVGCCVGTTVFVGVGGIDVAVGEEVGTGIVGVAVGTGDEVGCMVGVADAVGTGVVEIAIVGLTVAVGEIDKEGTGLIDGFIVGVKLTSHTGRIFNISIPLISGAPFLAVNLIFTLQSVTFIFLVITSGLFLPLALANTSRLLIFTPFTSTSNTRWPGLLTPE